MNKSKDILLSIAIPTFNSPTTLKQTLMSLEHQINLGDASDVEIIVSDNGSNYNLKEILSDSFSSDFVSKLKFNINEANIGYDNNLLKLVNLANGIYVKLLADDDVVESNFVNKYREILIDEPPDVIVNNFQFLDKELTTVLEPSWFNIQETTILDNKIRDLDLCRGAYGQVSSLTFKKTLVTDLKVPKVQSNYIHVYWFFSLFEEYSVKFERSRLIKVRQGSPNFSGNGIINITTPLGGIDALVESSLNNIDLKHKLISIQKKYCLDQLTSLDSQSFATRIKAFTKFIIYFKSSPKFWLFWAPFILMPNLLRRNLKKLRKRIIRLIKGMGYR